MYAKFQLHPTCFLRRFYSKITFCVAPAINEGLDGGSQKSLIVKMFAPESLLDKANFTKISIFEKFLLNRYILSHKNR